jgi:RimJ/RimL family protein N-acetyltransferase
MIDLALGRRRMRALFRHNRRGRLVAINEWSAGMPPRLHLMRTGAGALAGIRHDIPGNVAASLAALARTEPPALTEIPALADRYLAALRATAFRAGPAFVFPTTLPAEADVIAIESGNAELLQGGLESWRPDVGRRGPFLAIVEAGRAVALCASVRITRHVHCAGVETVPDCRGRGLASRVVTTWAARVHALGAVPFYSTSWDNLASRGVARRLGLEQVAVDFAID